MNITPSLEYITYPDPAAGWIDGVYRERVPKLQSAASRPDIGSVCRRFREKEESGWGVYEYHEGAVYTIAGDFRDLDVSIDAEVKGAASVSVYVDGVNIAPRIPVPDGGAVSVSFTARTCRGKSHLAISPDIPDGEDSVEAEIAIRSLSAEFAARAPRAVKPTLFLASDSTVQSYDPYYYPQTGWGEVLYRFFADADYVREYRAENSSYSQCRVYELPRVKIENRSIGGRSSRSFFLEGKWNELLARAREGDYVLIQFGHNDSTKARPNRYTDPDAYAEWIELYVRSAVSRAVTPILVTPVMRRNCGDGDFTISFPEFREKLLLIADKFKIPLLDLDAASLDICRRLGGEAAKSLYLYAEAGEYDGAYANGVHDDTHLSRRGALTYARQAALLMRDIEALAPIAALLDEKKLCLS